MALSFVLRGWLVSSVFISRSEGDCACALCLPTRRFMKTQYCSDYSVLMKHTSLFHWQYIQGAVMNIQGLVIFTKTI